MKRAWYDSIMNTQNNKSEREYKDKAGKETWKRMVQSKDGHVSFVGRM